MYFRAFFGVPDTLRTADGTPVNAIRGLLDMMATLVAQYSPDAVAAAWDNDWRPAWRVELVDTYKTHRLVDGSADVEETPDALAIQVHGIVETLDAAGVTIVGVDGYEADDVLASLARQGSRQGWRVLVVTGDRDLFQLVDDNVSVIYVGRGVAKHEVVDDHWLAAKYGVIAAQYADFATLRGDASDGLPGVKGVGEKTAAALLARFGDLESLLAAIDDPAAELASGVRAKLAAAADNLPAASRVVRCVDDLDVGVLDRLVINADVDPEAAAAVAEKWNADGPMTRLVDSLTQASRSST